MKIENIEMKRQKMNMIRTDIENKKKYDTKKENKPESKMGKQMKGNDESSAGVPEKEEEARGSREGPSSI